MIFRPDRNRRGEDATLAFRMALFAVGAVLALAGMLWKRDALVAAAIVILAIGLLVSIASRRRGRAAGDESSPPDG